jgi:hypothetical protein
MKYTVYSKMMIDLTPSSPRLVRHVILCRVLRVISWILLPLAYLGALFAPGVVLSTPFEIFHAHRMSSLVYWVTAVLMGAFILWMLYRTALTGLRSFCRHVIHVEAIVFSIGLVLAVVVVVWGFPPK